MPHRLFGQKKIVVPVAASSAVGRSCLEEVVISAPGCRLLSARQQQNGNIKKTMKLWICFPFVAYYHVFVAIYKTRIVQSCKISCSCRLAKAKVGFPVPPFKFCFLFVSTKQTILRTQLYLN